MSGTRNIFRTASVARPRPLGLGSRGRAPALRVFPIAIGIPTEQEVRVR
ncbi:MAG: hypothetical protein AAF430_05220 [Myxococcota bacterium]